MEALPSLALGPALGSCFGSVPRMTRNVSNVSSSIRNKGGALHTFFVPIVESYFPNVAWFDIKSIVRHIRFSLQMVL